MIKNEHFKEATKHDDKEIKWSVAIHCGRQEPFFSSAAACHSFNIPWFKREMDKDDDYIKEATEFSEIRISQWIVPFYICKSNHTQIQKYINNIKTWLKI